MRDHDKYQTRDPRGTSKRWDWLLPMKRETLHSKGRAKDVREGTINHNKVLRSGGR